MNPQKEREISTEEKDRLLAEFERVVRNNPITESDLAKLREETAHPFAVLDERERQVIELRYGIKDGLRRTQSEVGSEMGFSRSTAGRIEKAAINKLRQPSFS